MYIFKLIANSDGFGTTLKNRNLLEEGETEWCKFRCGTQKMQNILLKTVVFIDSGNLLKKEFSKPNLIYVVKASLWHKLHYIQIYSHWRWEKWKNPLEDNLTTIYRILF